MQPASWIKRGTKGMHIFIKVGGRLRGERLSYLGMYLLYIVFLSFSQKFSRSLYARSIAFHRPLRNASMQCALPTPFVFFLIFLVSISDCQLPKFTENTHKIAQNCVQNVQKLSAGMGGRAPWLFGGGIHAPDSM